MITIDSLCKYYKQGKDTVKALDNVYLSIDENEFVAVVGKSGSGKSTLLNMLGGMDSATSGAIYVDGIDILKLKENELLKFRRDNIGFIFQDYNLVPELNGKENIIFPVLLSKNKLDEKYYQNLIDTLEIGDRLNHIPAEMSGGQQQRVAIARAFINKPRFILCDEPTGNLDSETSTKVMQLIKKLHSDYDMTIILVTHDLEYAKIADRVIKLHDGKIVT
jgi:putative ABC transport system ATP-binding protein